MNPLLNLNIDVNATIRALVAMKAHGDTTIPMAVLLKFTLPKIGNSIEKMNRIKHLSELKDIVSISWLASNLEVTRQTIYNWKENGYLVFNEDGKISLTQTLELWNDLCWLEFL